MTYFDNATSFYVYALRDGRGWKLANGNLKDEVAANAFADGLRAEGLKVRVTRQDVTVLMAD
jgi:hypothetical protein